MQNQEIKLDPWQEEILKVPKGNHILLCKGRQIGGTFIMAKKCAERIKSQAGCQIVVSSITEDQAQLVIAMSSQHIDKKLIKKPLSRNFTKSIINLTNGSSMISRPVGATGNSVRGFTGNVLYLNEASRMAEFIFEAAKPILLTTAGEIWMDSTPFGIGTYFHKSYLNKNNRFKVFYHTSEKVMKERKISASWTKEQSEGAIRLLKEEKLDMTKLQYMQEYLGLFVGGLQRFIPDNLLNERCIVNPTAPYIPIGDKFQGIDIARMGDDDTVLVSGDRIKRQRLIQFDMEIPEGQELTKTARLIISKDKIINHKKIFMDDGGLGVGVYDILFEDEQTKRKVVGLNNARREIDRIMPDKERKKQLLGTEMALNFKMLMEQGRIDLFDDERLKQSLSSIQYENEDGVLKIHGKNTHIFEALKRLAHCMKDKSLNIWVA